MYETWRFIFVVSLLIMIGMLLPLAADAAIDAASPVLRHDDDAKLPFEYSVASSST